MHVYKYRNELDHNVNAKFGTCRYVSLVHIYQYEQIPIRCPIE